MRRPRPGRKLNVKLHRFRAAAAGDGSCRPRQASGSALQGVSAHGVCRRCEMPLRGDVGGTGVNGGSADGASGHGSATASLAAGRCVDVKAAGFAIAAIGIIAAVASEADPGGWGAALPSRAAIPAALGYDMTRYSPTARHGTRILFGSCNKLSCDAGREPGCDESRSRPSCVRANRIQQTLVIRNRRLDGRFFGLVV